MCVRGELLGAQAWRETGVCPQKAASPWRAVAARSTEQEERDELTVPNCRAGPGAKGTDWRPTVWSAEQGQGWKGKGAETRSKETRMGGGGCLTGDDTQVCKQGQVPHL